MAISRFYKDDACSYASSTSLSVTAPANLEDGDLLVVSYFHRSGVGGFSVPSGWTDHGDYDNGSNSQRTGIATKVAVSGDSSQSFSFSQSSSGRIGLHLTVYRGSVGDLAFSQIDGAGPTTASSITSPPLTETEPFVALSAVSNVFAQADAIEPKIRSTSDPSWTQLNTVSGGTGLNRLSAAEGFYDNETTPDLIWERVAVTSGAMACAAIAITESAATGPDFTLTANQGTYTLSGQAADLTASRLLTANQGSYTLTGQAATLAFTKVLEATQGSYSLSGQPAGLLASRVLTADQGSYILSGQDAALTVTVTLDAEQGSYTFTGQDAGLITSRLLEANQGSYSLTGQAATLTFQAAEISPLIAEQGSYTLTGQTADLVVSFKLDAVQGTYTLTGQDVDLIAQLVGDATGAVTRKVFPERFTAKANDTTTAKVH